MPIRHAGTPQARLVVPQRIDVIKDGASVDTFLRMSTNTDVMMVPIGPKLVVELIEGLRRCQLMTAPVCTTRQ